MMMDHRERRFSGLNGTHDYAYGKFRDENGYGIADRSDGYPERSPSRSSASKISRIPSPSSSPPPSTSSPPLPPGAGYIEHTVSKFDTLAGIAIKYGVEVADIKKMNGLVTDLQMFALKTLQIPLPGRHPPSPYLSNGEGSSEQASPCHEQTSSHCDNQDLFDSFQSLRLKSSERNGRKVSAAMDSLQGFYGLKHANRTISEGFQMAVYKKETSRHLEDDRHLSPSATTNPPLNHNRKSRSLVNALLAEISESEGGEIGSEGWNGKLTWRRQKSEADFTPGTPEMLLKEDNCNNGGFSAIAGKGLALRSKASSRTNLAIETPENGNSSPYHTDAAAAAADSFSVVRKSSSTSSLQEEEGNNNSTSLWPGTKWGLKPDLLTPAAITNTILDGLPKPLTGRRSKAALD